jgi:hypothetical protein
MPKAIETSNSLQLYRRITGTCQAIMVNFDMVTMENIRKALPEGIDAVLQKGSKVTVKIGPLPPNEEMMDYLEIPAGDFLVIGDHVPRHLTWKSFIAIYELTHGGNSIACESEFEFTFRERIRIFFGRKMKVRTTIAVDNPVIILDTKDDYCYVEALFPSNQSLSNGQRRKESNKERTKSSPSTT